MAIDAVNRGKITAFLTKPTPCVSIRSVVLEVVRTYQDNQGNITQGQENPVGTNFISNVAISSW